MNHVSRFTKPTLNYQNSRRYQNGAGHSYDGRVENKPETKISRETAGLCVDCGNAKRVESDRGSVFVLCKLSRGDARFAKYPRLPVLACAGYHPRVSADSTEL